MNVDAPVSTPHAAAVLERLSSLFAATLYITSDDVDPDQRFSLAGLDSILAVEYVTVVRAEFGISITVATLYEQETLRRLADHVSRLVETENERI